MHFTIVDHLELQNIWMKKPLKAHDGNRYNVLSAKKLPWYFDEVFQKNRLETKNAINHR